MVWRLELGLCESPGTKPCLPIYLLLSTCLTIEKEQGLAPKAKEEQWEEKAVGK